MGKHLDEPDDAQPRPPIWRTKVAFSAVLMLTVVVATVFGFRWLITDQPGTDHSRIAVNPDEDEPDDAASPDDETTPTDQPVEETTGGQSIVHVAGEVYEPGIVELADDARVIDAIEAAGGPTDQAQLDALNLAAVVNDGEYVLVPDRDTAADHDEGSQVNPAGPAGPEGEGAVNVNTADASALETLPGIGPATAADIIAHREQHGPFADLASLEEVSGIGPATRERLDGLISW